MFRNLFAFTKILLKTTLLLVFLLVENLIKIGIEARTRKYFFINFFDTTFWGRASERLCTSIANSVDDLNWFTAKSLVIKKNLGRGPLYF